MTRPNPLCDAVQPSTHPLIPKCSWKLEDTMSKQGKPRVKVIKGIQS